MSDDLQKNESSISNSSLYEILRHCAQLLSNDSLENSLIEDINDVWCINDTIEHKMISTNTYSTSGNISAGSCNSDEFGDNILEENGRISLAYENLRTIPRKIADKFAAQTKFLDLSYNDFRNLSFLTSFEDLHTLILDRNPQIEPSTLPYLPNLEILWLNNCNITKIPDWIQCIQRQCPSIKHLSIMGNPGTNAIFNYCTLQRDYLPYQAMPTAINCRDFILEVLPSLEYLDGVPRIQKPIECLTNGKVHGSSSTNNSACNGSSVSDHKEFNGHRAQTSPMLSFRNLFQLKRRKKSYQSSSTN